MPDFHRVSPGQRLAIQAKTWNAVLDITQRTSDSLGFLTSGDTLPFPAAPNLVRIKNESGQDVPRFGVLGISGVANNPTTNNNAAEAEFAMRPVLTGATPTADHTDRFVVTLAPIRNGEVGIAAVSGCFACKVNVGSTSHRYAGVKVGDVTQLQSADCGLVQLLWTAGTGAGKWAVGVM